MVVYVRNQLVRFSVFIFVFCTIIPIVTLEILVRLTNLATPFVDLRTDGDPLWNHDVHPMSFDPMLGWHPTPGASRIGWTLWDGANVNILSSGLRSNGFSSRSGTDFTILAVGDSFTFGDEVSDDETWPAYLEALLNQGVLNGGVSSYGFDQTVLRSERLVANFRPDMLIVSLIEEDVDRTEYSTRYYAPKPFFRVTKTGFRLDDRPLARWETISRISSPEFLNHLSRSSALAALISKRFISKIATIFDEDYMKRQHAHKTGTEISCHLMTRLGHLGKSYSIPILILAQYWILSRSKDFERVLQCAVDEGMEVIDPYDALQSVRKSSESEFDALFDGHMTAKGNHFIASFLSGYLKGTNYDALAVKGNSKRR